MSVLAVFFLLSIIGLSISPEVNQRTINEGLFNSEGKTLLLNQLFLLCCAGLGATFACLHKSRNYIKECNYDPKYDSTYWSMVIMGFMAGLIIAELIPTADLAHNNASISDFHKPLAALLGGFAADVIYSVLNRLVDVLNQLLGSSDQKTKEKVKSALTQADLAEQLHQQNKELKESISLTQDTNRQLLSMIAEELTLPIDKKQALMQQVEGTKTSVATNVNKRKSMMSNEHETA